MPIDLTHRPAPLSEPSPLARASAPPTGGDRADFARQRLRSLDAYRGLIMVALAFEAFGLAKTAALHVEKQIDVPFWSAVQRQFGHVEWVGCAFWDLIQPSFMFMVGVSMAFSYARRQERGDSYTRLLLHAAWRSVVLVLLGVFLTSNWSDMTEWSFANVLCQIGLGYFFVFLFWGRSTGVQAIGAALILAVTWANFYFCPHVGINPEEGAPSVGVSREWAQEHLTNVPAPWHKNANIAHAIDRWWLNLFPREKPFEFNAGGYQTTNFIPAMATMLFGLMVGELLRSARSKWLHVGILLLAAAGGLAAGWVLDRFGVCPIVKRIWTPSWALFSTGWCCLFLAALYLVIDVIRFHHWAWPLIIVGMNSIVMYTLGQLLKPWTAKTLQRHFGEDLFLRAGELYQPMLQATLVGLVFWLICLWMYRQRIFVRI